MPIYMYICPVCDAIEQIRVTSYDDVVVHCKQCEAEIGEKIPMTRMLSTPNVVYAAEGFYTTDHQKIKRREEEWDG